jgi:hypothetical protein
VWVRSEPGFGSALLQKYGLEPKFDALKLISTSISMFCSLDGNLTVAEGSVI